MLVDEYQDTNHAQYDLVKLLGGEHGLAARWATRSVDLRLPGGSRASTASCTAGTASLRWRRGTNGGTERTASERGHEEYGMKA